MLRSFSWTWFHILWKFESTFTFHCQRLLENSRSYSTQLHRNKNNIFWAIKDLFCMDDNWWIGSVVVMMASTFETEETEWLSSRHLRQRTRCVQGQFNLLWPCVGTRSFPNACLEVIWLFFWILSKSRFTMSENIISRAFQWDCDDFLQVKTQ